MAKSRKPKYDLATRRGVFQDGTSGNSWWMTLVRMPGRVGPIDLDELVDRLVERGVVGEVRRNIGAEILAGQVPAPSGKWALLVSLPGQPWAYLAPSLPNDYDLAADVARRSGLRTLGAGYQDTAGATEFDCFEGDEALVRFESCGMIGEEDEESGDATRFSGSRLPAEWIKWFASDDEALEALALEFDAFIPYVGAHSFESDRITLYGFDRREFKPKDFLRVDLLGFGPTRLEPSPAGRQLREAIEANDIPAIRAAVAAGADLRTLPGLGMSPLTMALGSFHDDRSRRDRAATLLELGADLVNPGEETPLHIVVADTFIDQAEIIGVLEVLLDHGAAVDGQGRDPMARGRTPLHVVAMKNWLAVAKFLVARGADVHATDSRGHTPRRITEDVAELMKSQGFSDDFEAKYAPLIAFFADAEAGRAGLDWRADAEEASRAELRRRREMKLAMGRIGAGFKALGAIQGEDPPAEAVVKAVVFGQPDAIHLEPYGEGWWDETSRAAMAASLLAEGFEPIGRFRIPELSLIYLDAFLSPREHFVAVHYDASGQSIIDLIRYHGDDTRLTVTNNTSRPEAQFATPDRRTIRLPSAPLPELLAALRADPPPPSGVIPVAADEFVARFEDAYRREIKARKREARRP